MRYKAYFPTCSNSIQRPDRTSHRWLMSHDSQLHFLPSSSHHDGTTSFTIFYHITSIANSLVRLRCDLVIHTLQHLCSFDPTPTNGENESHAPTTRRQTKQTRIGYIPLLDYTHSTARRHCTHHENRSPHAHTYSPRQSAKPRKLSHYRNHLQSMWDMSSWHISTL